MRGLRNNRMNLFRGTPLPSCMNNHGGHGPVSSSIRTTTAGVADALFTNVQAKDTRTLYSNSMTGVPVPGKRVYRVFATYAEVYLFLAKFKVCTSGYLFRFKSKRAETDIQPGWPTTGARAPQRLWTE